MRSPAWIVLIEGWGDVDPFCALADDVATGAAFGDAVAPPDIGVYRLQNARGPLPWSVA